MGSDSNFDDDDAKEDMSSDSDYSGSEKETNSDCGESSDVKTDSQVSQGTDWEEMEERSKKE